MKLSPIEQNKKFKEQKKLSKLALSLEQKKAKRLQSLKSEYDTLIANNIAKIKKRYETKLNRRISKIEKQYDRKRIDTKKKIQGKEVKKKLPSIGKIKQGAYSIYQYWRKLSLADDEGMVVLADKKTKVHWTECVAGHIYSKSGNGHMAFLDMNVWCITSDTNRIQGTSPGIFWAVNVLNQKELDYLKGLSENKILKNEIRDRNFYQTKYDYYLEQSKVQEKRLGLTNI